MTIGRLTCTAVILVVLVLIQNALANYTATVAEYHTVYNDDPPHCVKLTTSSESVGQDPDCSHSQQWFCFNSTTKTYSCLHGSNTYLRCSEYGPLLKLGYCATYSDDTGLLTIAKCPYFQMNSKGYNVTMITGDGYYIHLPKTLAELNDSMCRPMNRKGIVCSECIDGFGPSVSSIGYRCANCTDDPWYKVPLFLVLLFAPITIFYLFILTFQISMTSPPTPYFIMYAQVTVMSLYFVDLSKLQEIFYDSTSGHLRLDAKIMFTLYGIFNLDFFYYNILPPFCISSRLKPIHIAFFGYISALYPVLLIFLTWLCVKLHGYNFRPIVCLWRPFHRCCVKLRRSWDNKNDIIDVFTTFFLLSYLKFLYQFQLLLFTQLLRNYNSTVGHAIQVSTNTRILMDLRVTADSSEHIPFTVIAGIVLLVFFIVPTLLLMLYPIRLFRRLLSKYRLDFIALSIFADKIHRDYENGLNGGRDMRSLSGIYFILRMLLILSSGPFHSLYDPYAIGCAVLLGCALMIALLKPYSKSYMNYLDTILLGNYVLIWYTMTSRLVFSMVLKQLLLFILPMVIFILGIILRRMSKTKIENQVNKIYHYTKNFLNKARNLVKDQQEHQPLLQP